METFRKMITYKNNTSPTRIYVYTEYNGDVLRRLVYKITGRPSRCGPTSVPLFLEQIRDDTSLYSRDRYIPVICFGPRDVIGTEHCIVGEGFKIHYMSQFIIFYASERFDNELTSVPYRSAIYNSDIQYEYDMNKGYVDRRNDRHISYLVNTTVDSLKEFVTVARDMYGIKTVNEYTLFRCLYILDRYVSICESYVKSTIEDKQ